MKFDNIKVCYYKSLLLSMRVAKYKGEINIAKPVLMLAIMELISANALCENKIVYDESLVRAYKKAYARYCEKPKITSPIYPYYYLKNEEFYHLVGDISIRIPSAKFIRENVEYAELDEDLWTMTHDSDIREYFRESIIKHYLNS